VLLSEINEFTIVQGGAEPTDTFQMVIDFKCVSRLLSTLYERILVEILGKLEMQIETDVGGRY